jgi:lipopolysaccharide export system permease protein
MPDFFPSRTVTIYMAKLFLTRSFAVLALLVLVLQALDLLGESEKILAHPGNGQAQILEYVSLRVPAIIQRFLPFSVLLGTLIAFMTLNQNSEVIAMKAAGLSAHQVLAPFIVASLLLAVVSFVFNERIVTRAVSTLTKWEAVEFGPIPDARGGVTNVWVRDGDDLIHADIANGRGMATRLTNVSVYDRTGGVLKSVIDAATAKPVAGGGWELTNARAFDVASGVRRSLGTVRVAKEVRPDQFTLASVDPLGLSYSALSTAIEDLDAAGRPTASLKANLWHKFSGPLSTVLMPLLAAVAAFGLARSGKLFVRAVIGMALGFAYFVADNFGLAMGNLGAYPPLLAAWGPFVLFLALGEAVLIRTEE